MTDRRVEALPNAGGRGTLLFRILAGETVVAQTAARPKATQTLARWAVKHGSTVEALLAAAKALEPQPLHPLVDACRPTGNARVDAILADCGIPPLDAPAAGGTYVELLGEHHLEATRMPDAWPQSDASTLEGLVAAERIALATAAPVQVRDRKAPQSSAEASTLALAVEQPGRLITWRDRTDLAAVDADWHGAALPAGELDILLDGAKPKPLLRWKTPRGLRLIYSPLEPYTAAELASMAAVWLYEVSAQPPTGIEILTRTWAPNAGVAVLEAVPDTALFEGWLRPETLDAKEEDVRAWLDLRGLTLGVRAGPEHCPSNRCGGRIGTTPVSLTEGGIHCFHASCARTWTWAEVLGRRAPSILRQVLDAFAPFDLAAPMLQQRYPTLPLSVLRSAWRVCLALVHGKDDPRIPKAMQELGLVRGADGAWLNAATLRVVQPQNHVLSHVVPQMSSTMYLAETKQGIQAKNAPVLIARHKTNQPIAGIPTVRPVWGISLWSVFRGFHDHDIRRIAPNVAGRSLPRYLPPAERDLEWAWSVVEQSCPGLDRSYLQALIVGRAYAESGHGLPPMMLVLGPSGAGKTATIQLAAAMLGDGVRVLPQGAVGAKFSEALAVAASEVGFIVLDDYLKQAPTARGRLELLQQLLPLNRHVSSRQVFRGPVTTPLESLLVVTDVAVPTDVLTHAQLGRRLVLIRLSRRVVDWQATAGDLEAWRTDVDRAWAADMILSDVVDRHLGPHVGHPPTFSATVERLGLTLLEQHELVTADTAAQAAVRALHAATGADAEGWLLLVRGSALYTTWRGVCDDESGLLSSSVDELDLAAVLGLEGYDGVELQRNLGSDGLRIRFAGRPKGGREWGPLNGAAPTSGWQVLRADENGRLHPEAAEDVPGLAVEIHAVGPNLFGNLLAFAGKGPDA